MKQLFFVLHGKEDNYSLAGIYGSMEKAIKMAKAFKADNYDHFEVKIYSGNFGIVDMGKEEEKL
ncbi:hypothetical protein LCGC14_0926830 [marine sediment metagenome]|uniref:Uncharacterized protein n=1 Tax=marine sediment metagenome TaxID=412755 RepID=A0A0F9NPC2_9ZZZZ|nr:hypothetical protein [Candidatus Aminicenantes bacterium]